MTPSSDSNTSVPERRRTLLPLGVLGMGLVLSGAGFALVRNAISENANLRFQREASDAKHMIERRILSYVEIIRGLRALFATRGTVGRDEFHRYVTSLDLARNFPGFETLNYGVWVPGPERRRFEEVVRRDTSLVPGGHPGFAIKPPGERPSYVVLVYVEPMEGNEAAFGLDILANPRVAQAAEATRDTGAVITSGRLVRTKGDPGLAMRLAVYESRMPLATVEQRRAAYIGSVGAGFNVRRLMHGALGPNDPGYLQYRLYDAGPIGERRPAARPRPDDLLFDSASLAQGPTEPPEVADRVTEFGSILPMEVGGRKWELHFRAPRRAAVGEFGVLLPWMVLGGAVFASTLLFAMFQAVVSSRSRALRMGEELRQRSAQLEDAVSELESFSYTVSHDLRAPLRHMSGFAGMLREAGPELGAAARARYLASIAEAASKMGSLIDDLLAFSRTSRAPLKLGRVDLGVLVDEVRRECLRDAGQRDVEWRIAELPAVEADSTLLRIALVNLVGNAVKFTGRRERALIEIGVQDGTHGEAVVYVRDNGAGFEMSHSSKLFGVFQRLHAHGEFPGTGIGLVTVRRIIQRHGGRIWAQAAPDAGATFYFTLKRAP